MIIGPYTVESVVARHGTATLYMATREASAEDAAFAAPVLLLVLPPRPLAFADSFKQRVDATRWLNHPNIQPFTDAGYLEDQTYYKAFAPLPQLIPSQGRMLPESVLTLSAELASALDYAHSQGVAHGAVSRGTVVCGQDDQAMLRGFEFATAPVTPAQDIIALAQLIHFALTGREGDLTASKDLPRPLLTVLRHAQRGGFESAGLFHAALTRALQSPEINLQVPLVQPPPVIATPEPLIAPATSAIARARSRRTQTATSETKAMETVIPTQKPPLERPSSPSFFQSSMLALAIVIPIIGGVIGALVLVNNMRQESTPQDPTSAAIKFTVPPPTAIPPTETPIIPTAANLPTQPPAVLPTTDPAQLTTMPLPTTTPAATQTQLSVVTATGMGVIGPVVDSGILPTGAAPTGPVSNAPTIPPLTQVAAALPDAVVNADDGVLLRAGPDRQFYSITTLSKDTAMVVTARNSDGQWLRVRVDQTEGWVSSTYVTINVDLEQLAAVPDEEIAKLPRTRYCVDVVGDSVPHGDGIFDFPGTGYAFVSFEPLATFIEKSFRDAGVEDLKVIDRSVSGTGISFALRSAYPKTKQYQGVLLDHCKFTVVLPWVGDLSNNTPDPVTAAPIHAKALDDFMQGLVTRNPFGHFYVMNYYKGAPSTYVQTVMAKGFTSDAIVAFNTAILEQCQRGDIAQMKQVTCIDADPIFAGLGLTYIIGPMTRAQVEQDLVAPMKQNEIELLNQYLTANPGGSLVGDGIHLNVLGKTTLANYLVKQLMALPDFGPMAVPAAVPTVGQ